MAETIYPRIGLAAFCGLAESESRKWMHKPWKQGKFVYATNGHLLIEVEKKSLPGPFLESMAGKAVPADRIKQMLDEAFAKTSWQSLPILPNYKPCYACGGTGLLQSGPCDYCDGYGEEQDCIRIADTGYCIRYLRLLSSLSGIQISPNGPEKACALRFDGGRGILMPMA